MNRLILLALSSPFALAAQEALSGFDLRGTVSAELAYSHELSEGPRAGAPVTPGFRAVFYPTWKIGKHWNVSGAVEVISRPYFQEDFHIPGRAVEAYVLQAAVGYSQVWRNASVRMRAGQLSSSFGAFLLRYDDADNALVGNPLNYGYYGAGVNTLGLMGVQLDATAGKWDARVQLTNSSPANPRGIFDKDQYANWASGVGYTVVQGLRLGVSEYRGPYLDRQSPYFFPGESKPRDLPATALGADAEWARGHWNVYGEWQHMKMTYHAIPDFRQVSAYVEVRRVLHPRWYIAARAGGLTNSVHAGKTALESAIGFRPSAHELIKFGYILTRDGRSGQLSPTIIVQAVTSIHPLSFAWN